MFYQVTVDRMPGFLERAFVQQADQRTELAYEAHLILWREGGVADRLHAKHVHDLFPAQAGTQFGALAQTLSVRGFRGRAGNHRLTECVDLAFLDVQSECRQEAADGGEFCKVVVGDDRQLKDAFANVGHRTLGQMIRRQSRCQPDMLCDRGERYPAEISSVHPGDKIAKNIRRDVRREGSEGLKQLFTVRVGHWGASISHVRSLCAMQAASIMPRRQDVEKGTLSQRSAHVRKNAHSTDLRSRIGAAEVVDRYR